MKLETGLIISGYKIIEEIGAGGMGTVYKAIDINLERTVAIKTLNVPKFEDKAIRRFQREASAIAKCDHPGIIKIFSYGEYQKSPYYVMEYVNGKPLDSFLSKAKMFKSGELNAEELRAVGDLNEDPSLPYFIRDPVNHINDTDYVRKVCLLIAEIADSLSAAHSLGILHRDIKPSNILINMQARAKLADFGLAKNFKDSDLTGMNQFLGTIKYMAPECFKGSKAKVNQTSDIYSLGILFYELLTLEHPTRELDTNAIILKTAKGDFENPKNLNPNIPSDLVDVILTAIKAKQEKRFQTAEEFAEAIRLTSGYDVDIQEPNVFDAILGLFMKKRYKRAGRNEKKFSLVQNEIQDVNSISPNEVHVDEIAKNLYFEAKELFFVQFDFMASIEKFKEALTINPQFIEAALLLTYNYNSIGDSDSIKRLYEDISKFKNDLSTLEKLKLDILYELFINKNYKTAKLLTMKYLSIEPENTVVLLSAAVADGELENTKGFLDYIQKVLDKYPEYNFFHLMQSDVYSHTGETEKSISIIDERIKKYPKLVNLRLLKSRVLRDLGRHKEALEHVEAIIKEDPNNEYAYLAKIFLNIYNKKYDVAVNQIKHAISLNNNGSEKALEYYYLYLINFELKDYEKAEKYLKIARNLGKGYCFKSIDERKNYILNQDISQLTSDNISKSFTDFVKQESKDLCVQSSGLPFPWGLTTITSYYHIDPTMECSNFTVFSDYNGESDEFKFKKFIFDSVPLTPFIDKTGEIMKVSYKINDTAYGKYFTEIIYPKIINPGESTFFAAEFDSSNILQKKEDGFEIKFKSIPSFKKRYYQVIIGIPDNFKVEIQNNVKPYKLEKIENQNMYCFRTFLFQDQQFEIAIKLL